MEPLNKLDKLDKLDKLILNRLQINGRAAYDQIANTVSLSPSAVLRRVKRLEAASKTARPAFCSIASRRRPRCLCRVGHFGQASLGNTRIFKP